VRLNEPQILVDDVSLSLHLNVLGLLGYSVFLEWLVDIARSSAVTVLSPPKCQVRAIYDMNSRCTDKVMH